MEKILLVDDDVVFVESVSLLLDSRAYKVITAHNGKEGFEKAVEEKPNLIFLDVMMSRTTEGYQVARKLSQNEATKDIPVVMITGIRGATSLPFELKPDEDWLPVKAVLEKPVLPEEILKAVKENIK